ncbi:hypothetical protein [Streptomyces shenzhenensis]|uniref:hypothetical protein n=1 Tax=Streptomyces shenzhenensis TaxID=943815 RepID=UPI001604F721|nr:hypothetical protein [Streptomyces shenzhenensis]
MLAVLRHDQRLADMAGGNHVSATPIRRWRDELNTLLAAKAPRLDRALKKIARRGGEVVLIDGTLIPTQRRTKTANRPNCSGKHHRHGLHVLALTDERGRMIWISAARPVALTTSPPPAVTASCPTYAPPASAPWPISASSAWTTTRMTPWSSPASRPPAPRSSTASPVSRTDGSSPRSAPLPPYTRDIRPTPA